MRSSQILSSLILATMMSNAVAVCAAAPELNAVGSVAQLAGTVELERNGQKSTPALSSAVLVEDVFTTQRASSVVIRLVGGSELQVGQSSSIRIDRHQLSTRDGARFTLIKLLRGKVHSFVPAVLNGGSFSVLTGNAISGVRGTEFDTAYIVGKPCPGFPDCLRYTDVGVYKGVVEVRSLTNRQAAPVRVSEGYETTVPCEIPPSSPSPLGATELEQRGYH